MSARSAIIMFAGQSFSTVLRHMGNHRYDPGLSIRCGINSCTETYKNFESFRSHVNRKHREALARTSHAQTVNADGDAQEHSDSDEHLAQDESDVEWDDQESNEEQKRLAALFLLKTREERKVTQTALNGIVQDFRGMWRDSMETLQVSYLAHTHAPTKITHYTEFKRVSNVTLQLMQTSTLDLIAINFIALFIL